MSANLKREFLSLLEKDVEFRYAVAGYLGLSEILKKMDALIEEQHKLWENQNRLWENQNRLWEEIKSLREDQHKLWENQNKLWEEIRTLREGQNKLWENQNRLWEEVKSLREGQNKLWENQNRLWEEIRSLREEQHKLWEEVKSLREGQNKLWEEVKALREGQNKLWESHNRLSDRVGKLEVRVGRLERSVDRLRDAMIAGFGELGKFAGVTFESFVRRFLSRYLRGIGVLSKGGRLVRVVIDGEEINIFSEEPLIVGEVTAYAESVDEINKLLRKVNLVREKYGKEPLRKYLIVLRASKSVAHELKKIARENNIELILGKIM
jgi:predicted  nucleic acid-binding Zn-ribbon protein